MEAQELTTYCATRRPPAFAEGAEADRLGALSRLVSGAGLPHPDLSPAVVASTPSPLIETASRRLVSDADLETGALGNELVTQAWTVLCYETDVEAWLPSLCAPMNDDQALLALRKRVIADIARLPSTALDRFAPQLPPETRDRLAPLAPTGDLPPLPVAELLPELPAPSEGGRHDEATVLLEGFDQFAEGVFGDRDTQQAVVDVLAVLRERDRRGRPT